MVTRKVKRPACPAHHPVGGMQTDSQRNRNRRAQGFTLVDLMGTIAIVALLAALSVPSYDAFIQRARIAAAIADIGSMQIRLENFRTLNNGMLPATLDVLGTPTDPWGNPYQYINIESGLTPPRVLAQGPRPGAHQFGLRPLQHGKRWRFCPATHREIKPG